jgi:hypothetical protein
MKTNRKYSRQPYYVYDIFGNFAFWPLYFRRKNPSTHWAGPRGGVDVVKTGKIVVPGESRNMVF